MKGTAGGRMYGYSSSSEFSALAPSRRLSWNHGSMRMQSWWTSAHSSPNSTVQIMGR